MREPPDSCYLGVEEVLLGVLWGELYHENEVFAVQALSDGIGISALLPGRSSFGNSFRKRQ